MNRAIARLCIFAGAASLLTGCGAPSPIEVTRSVSGQDEQRTASGWKIIFRESGSNPVIAEGVLYVGSADGAVYALDPQSGETKWRFQTGESLSPATSFPNVITVPRGTSSADQMTAGISAAEKQKGEGRRRVDMTPAVENGTVFIGSGDQSFYAIDAATGKKKWSYVAGPGMVSNIFVSNIRPPPVLKNNTVYFETTSGLHAVDSLTGKGKWLFNTPHSYDTPKGPIVGDGVIFLTARSSLFAIDPESGKAKWTRSTGFDISVRTTAKGLVFVAVNERTTLPAQPNRSTLHAINAADGQSKWTVGAKTIWGARALFVADERIYFSTDTSLLALEMETGRQLWSYSADNIGAGLQADARHLYFVSYKESLVRPNHTLHALALATGQEKWSRGLSGNARIAMVEDGVVYAGAYAIDAATGNELWSFKETGRESARLISRGRVFLTSPTVSYIGTNRVDQGYLYAIDAKTGKLDPR